MPYKDPEKRRANARDYREKNKEKISKQRKEYHEKNREKLRIASIVYRDSHKEEIADYRATHKEERIAYYKKNKEKLNRKGKEYYQNNSEAVIQRTTRYHFEHKEWRKKYYDEYYQKIRLGVLARIDPDMKCAMCGCDDTRFLEVNHIKGGGRKEQKGFKDEDHASSQNIIMLIHKGKRDVEDLNLLCRICNSIDHLERVYGKTGLRVIWDKKEHSLNSKSLSS